jgi:pimeloyl-ACP methyl ester carboxylesterase
MGLTAMKTDVARAVSDTAKLGWAITREAGASLLTYELYPLGLVGNSMPVLPGPQLWRKQDPTRLPILFIHGVFHNRATFAWLKQKLVWEGWSSFQELNLFTSLRSIPVLAEQTALEIDSLLKKLQVQQVDIIAHSLGGLVARHYLQKMGGDGKVRNLFTLGTPHQGTRWSRFAVLPHLKQLAPQSELLEELNRAPSPEKTQVTVIYGTLDIFTLPRHSGAWRGVDNIELDQVGHAGLLFSKRVAQIILSRLRTSAVSAPECRDSKKSLARRLR